MDSKNIDLVYLEFQKQNLKSSKCKKKRIQSQNNSSQGHIGHEANFDYFYMEVDIFASFTFCIHDRWAWPFASKKVMSSYLSTLKL